MSDEPGRRQRQKGKRARERSLQGGKPLTPAAATRLMNAVAAKEELTLSMTAHARDQVMERNLTIGDVLHALRRGFVHDQAQPTTRAGIFKYRIESATPNSHARHVAVVVIPVTAIELKVITVMWADEPTVRS